MLQKAGEKVGIMLQRQGRNLGIMLQRKFYGSTEKMGTAVQRFPFAQHTYHSTRDILFPFSLYPIFALFSYGTSHLANGEKLGYYEDTKKE